MLNVKLTRGAAAAVCGAEKKEAAAAAWKTLLDGAAAGKNGFGWMNLPEADISGLVAMGKDLRKYSNIIVIGIGGSALGLQMLMNAFCEPCYPALRAPGQPVLFVADNADAESNEAIWKQVDPKNTAILVVSKSGRTLETLSGFLFFRERLFAAVGEKAEERIYFITDPVKGFLRAYANEKHNACAVLPEDTGGRYSVFSSCGLVAAVALGIDAQKLLDGAAAMKKALLAAPAGEDLASTLAWETFDGMKKGRNITVFWAYGDRLRQMGEWFAQLWGESIGKDGIGMTPQCALGSIDQHSQLQLYACGPADKFFFFLSTKPGNRAPLSVPNEKLFDEAQYMNGMSQEFILECERRGVAASLKRAGRPVCEIELDRIDETTIGGLVLLLEATTALTGFMMGVDPFDQPGVEEGKNYALALCGNASYAKYKETLAEIEKASPAQTYSVEG
jgi:glucose-6-phosphate isomerase